MGKTPKAITTFRTAFENKKRLLQLGKSSDRTTSYLVNVAVREFLERRSKT